jgi:DNA-binding MarR family transcriptional regulator
MKSSSKDWTFFTNHGHVYFLLATKEKITLREVSDLVGITERSVAAIVGDLEKEKYIKKIKVGRSNSYRVLPKKRLKHPLESGVELGHLTEVISGVSRRVK